MISQKVLYDGQDDALPEQVELRAGPLSLIYQQGDLRYICLENHEILRRVTVAIRDRDWKTVTPIISNVKMNIEEDSFQVSYHVELHQNEINFSWDGLLHGDSDGTITFSMEGLALSTFLKNRIGFCILHPASLAGIQAEVQHTNGSVDSTNFPIDFIANQPVLPFAEMKSITYQVKQGVCAKVEFKGDVFEMEDQRNWTDASFKTFCPPLSLPYPVVIQQGTKITQSITLSLQTSGSTSLQDHEQEISILPLQNPVLTIDLTGKTTPIPTIGLGMASHGHSLSSIEVERLRGLHLTHLRTDLSLSDPNYKIGLRSAVNEANRLGLKLELAFFIPGNPDQELIDLRKELDILQPKISAFLCYPQIESYQGGSPLEAVVAASRKILERYDSSIPFYTGTNSDLIFLKRSILPLDQTDGICFAICPQVHAFDNDSMVETLEMQGKAVTSACHGNGLPVRVSPVTLKMRFNPYATGPIQALEPGELPPQVDVRQMSMFGACWTACSFKSIAEAGAQSITYYETTGWRGVMETQEGSSLPDIFQSLSGTVFPVYHILAEIGDFYEGNIIPIHSSHPLQANGFLLRRDQSERMLVTNFLNSRKVVQVNGLEGQVFMRILDEKNVISAMRYPEAYRMIPGVKREINNGVLNIELEPYAIAVIETKT